MFGGFGTQEVTKINLSICVFCRKIKLLSAHNVTCGIT